MRKLTAQMAGVIAVLALIIVVIVVDIHTSLWQELVILSGLVAGVITFLLTTFFIDRILQRHSGLGKLRCVGSPWWNYCTL